MTDLLKFTAWNSVQDGGLRNLLGAFMDGKTLSADSPEAKGVQDLDATVADLALRHGLQFEWETDQIAAGDGNDGVDFTNVRYTLRPESDPMVQVLLGIGKDGEAAA